MAAITSDSHRSIAFVAGAYVKQGTLVSTQYNTLDFLRTIEEVLGLAPMNLNDALAHPMADIFNTTPSSWSFAAAPAAMLYARIRNCRCLPSPPPYSFRSPPTTRSIGRGRPKEWTSMTPIASIQGLQQHSLERDDGQQTLSSRAHRSGPSPEPRNASRALPAVSKAPRVII